VSTSFSSDISGGWRYGDLPSRVRGHGRPLVRRRTLPQGDWEVLIKTTIADSSTGTPTWPTRPAWAATSARWRTNPEPERWGKAAPCSKGWRPAGHGDANSLSSTTARPNPPPATTAPAPASSSTARAAGTCASPATERAHRGAARTALQRLPMPEPPPLRRTPDSVQMPFAKRSSSSSHSAGRALSRSRITKAADTTPIKPVASAIRYETRNP
jgi:hypothetical protein